MSFREFGPNGLPMENERKRKCWKTLESLNRAEKAVEYLGDGDINCSFYVWKSLKFLVKKTKGIRNQSQNCDHPHH